jgi:hypothetical protein
MASPERKRDEVDPSEIATTLEEALKRGNEGDVDLTHITLAGRTACPPKLTEKRCRCVHWR